MTWLTEDPTPILVVGAAIVAVLAVAFYRTGRVVMAVPIVLVILLVGGAFLIDLLVVTEKEAVEETLFGAVAAIERNDAEALIEFISPQAEEIRRIATSVLKQVDVTEATIIDGPKVTINKLTNPPSAIAELRARAKGKIRGAPEYRGPFPMDFVITLHRIDGRWLVASYERDFALGL